MLTIFRRHLKDCPHRSRRYRRCHCPIQVEGSLRGEKIRKALDLTSWDAADDLIRAWNTSGQIGVVKPDIPTIKEAIRKFFEDATARNLKPPTIKKLKNLLENRLVPWCDSRGISFLKQLDVDAVRQFRTSWKDGPISAAKNIERTRSFFRFCQDARWIDSNPAKALKHPKTPSLSERVKVFGADELQKVLEACDRYPEHNSYGHNNRERVRALVLTLRYSGLRIGDCVTLKKEHLDGDRLFLRTQKTGTPVYIPLPQTVVDQLKVLKTPGEYFFWSGNGLRDSVVSNWERSLRKLFKLADVTGNPHMFRHSWATDLLSRGVPIEDVSILMGHATPLVTAKYYSHFVKARRERLEERVRTVWSDGP